MDFHSRIVRLSLNSLSMSIIVPKTKDSIDNHRCEKYSFETKVSDADKIIRRSNGFQFIVRGSRALVRMRGWIFARQTVRLQSRCGRAAVAATPCTRPPVTRSNRSGSVRSFLREIDGHAFSTFDFGKSSILANRGGLGDDPRAEFSSDESSSFFLSFFFYLSSASVFWIILRWLIFIFEREFFFQFLKYLVETNIERERVFEWHEKFVSFFSIFFFFFFFCIFFIL